MFRSDRTILLDHAVPDSEKPPSRSGDVPSGGHLYRAAQMFRFAFGYPSFGGQAWYPPTPPPMFASAACRLVRFDACFELPECVCGVPR